MNAFLSRLLVIPGLIAAGLLLSQATPVQAQIPVSNHQQRLDYKHGIEQYHHGHYVLAAHSLKQFLAQENIASDQPKAPNNYELRLAQYYLALSQLQSGDAEGLAATTRMIEQTTDPALKQRAAFTLAQYYFRNNNLGAAIPYYEIAGVSNLSNSEIADAKFELAYSYFNEHEFDQAKTLFASIKEIKDNKYFIAGNYYYGLLAYNDKNYKQALKSFERISNEPSYSDVIPYYEAEIHYFMGNSNKVLEISKDYLAREDTALFYRKEMRLLTGQTYFEQRKFEEALPHFEYYYENSERIRKEELYELAFTYYRLEQWKPAIDKFKQLSSAEDSLGQTSMYLLGDCYLKTGDKKGAMNAFGICANMPFNPSQRSAATFLHAKLAYELGHDGLATNSFYDYIRNYPTGEFSSEARTLLSGLLAKSNNYSKAFEILNDLAVKDGPSWGIYQKVAVGYALQLMQDKKLNSADSVLSLSLQQPVEKAYEAIAYFWKGEIAYREKRNQQAIQYNNNFLTLAKNNEQYIKSISPQATVPNAQVTIGYAQMNNEDYDQAASAFSAAGTSSKEGSGTNAEATLRAADASFMLKHFSKADKLYDDALAAGVRDGDYARFQKSLIAGLTNRSSEKIQLLQGIIYKQPASRHREAAQYELAVTQLELGQTSNAIIELKKLSDHAADNSLQSKALLKLAYAYQQSAQNEQAITAYTEFVEKYPSSDERPAAVEALRNLYISSGEPEKYAVLRKELDLPNEDQSTLEQTFYAAAETDFAAGNWEKAVASFTKYLDQFPDASATTKAHFYRAESYKALGNTNEALADYTVVVAAEWSDFTADAAANAAALAMSKGQYEQAEKHYGVVRDQAMDNKQLQEAYVGLMRAAFKSDRYQQSGSYADTLLQLSDLSSTATAEAELYKAKSLDKQNQTAAAVSIYEVLDKKNIGAISAEARYRIAEILLERRELKKAEEKASHAAQNAGGSEYWVVKSYILMGNILKEQKDYFNAKATLQSILQNAKDEALKDEAQVLLDEVIQLERIGSKLNVD